MFLSINRGQTTFHSRVIFYVTEPMILRIFGFLSFLLVHSYFSATKFRNKCNIPVFLLNHDVPFLLTSRGFLQETLPNLL
jgi:hypothetical protein